MSTDSAQNLATEQAAERVDKAAWMNQQLADRLHQYDAEPFGVKPAKAARADNDYPVKGGKAAKVADKP
jgi:hypothetical protein